MFYQKLISRTPQSTTGNIGPTDSAGSLMIPASSGGLLQALRHGRMQRTYKYSCPVGLQIPFFTFSKMTPKPQNSNSHTDFGKDPLDIEAKLQTDHVEAATGDVISLDPKDPGLLAHIQDELAWAHTLSPAEFAEVERKLVRKVSPSQLL